MGFKKTGETEVYKKPQKGFTKRTAEEEEEVRYTVDDLVEDSDKGFDPYKEDEKDVLKKESPAQPIISSVK